MLSIIEKLLIITSLAFYYFQIFFIPGDPVFIGRFNVLDGSAYVVRFWDLLGAVFIVFSLVYFLVPRVLDQGKVFRFLLFSLGTVTLAGTVVFLLDLLTKLAFNIPFDPEIFTDKDLLYRKRRELHPALLSKISLVYIIGLTYSLSREWVINFSKRQRQKRENLAAELKYLRSQINPHFLFNTLNNIYATAIRNNDKNTADAILQLSGMMRYMLTEAGDEFIPLKQEVEQINNYLALIKLRFTRDDPVSINFDYPEELENIKIAPLLLMPFIENAVKHGISTDREGFINIVISTDNKKLLFQVKNSDYSNKNDFSQSSGIGLDNVRKRLNLIYPRLHKLRIENSKSEYCVNLTIDTGSKS